MKSRKLRFRSTLSRVTRLHQANPYGFREHVTAPVGYVRLHGRNYKDWFRKTAGRDERYDYLYSAAELKPWAERTKALALEPSVTDVYVVNNNHFAGQAVTNALMLEAQVTQKPVKVPETLLSAYPKELSPLT